MARSTPTIVPSDEPTSFAVVTNGRFSRGTVSTSASSAMSVVVMARLTAMARPKISPTGQLAAAPIGFAFLWAPLVDRFALPGLPHRIG